MLKLKQLNKCDTSQINSSPNGILMPLYAYNAFVHVHVYIPYNVNSTFQVSISVSKKYYYVITYYLTASNKFSDLRIPLIRQPKYYYAVECKWIVACKSAHIFPLMISSLKSNSVHQQQQQQLYYLLLPNFPFVTLIK